VKAPVSVSAGRLVDPAFVAGKQRDYWPSMRKIRGGYYVGGRGLAERQAENDREVGLVPVGRTDDWRFPFAMGVIVKPKPHMPRTAITLLVRVAGTELASGAVPPKSRRC
jgi:hypothetical protein